MPLLLHSLHTRLLVAVTLAMMTGTLGLAYWTATAQSRHLLQARTQQAELLVGNLAEGCAYAYAVEDYAVMEDFLRHAAVLPGLRRVVATDTQGRVLTALHRTGDSSPLEPISGLTAIKTPPAATTVLQRDGDTLVVWHPVAAGGLLGWLQAVYGLEEIDLFQRQIWRQGIILCLVEVVSGIGLFALLLHRPISAIKRLSGFARELPAHRGMTIQVNQSVTEINDLGESLNYASRELARIEQQLSALNQSLQRQVEEEVAKSREKDLLLLQQARYQTLGELLVNISHHWRQPLNAIGATIQEQAWQIANGELPPAQAVAKAEEVMVALQQLSHSLEGFRQLCQPATSAATFLPSAVVATAVAAISEGYRLQGITIRQELQSERPIHGSPHDLIQVLLNLLSNARDALLANRTAGRMILLQIALATADQVQITMSDNGGGISDQVRSTLFDPYVTTKFRAQGVGMGLFVVRQLIEQRFGGTVTADNCGDGAQLRVVIPIE